MTPKIVPIPIANIITNTVYNMIIELNRPIDDNKTGARKPTT